MKKNLFLIFAIYSIFGIVIFEALDNKLFTFLYQNGFEVIIKFIFSESTNFIERIQTLNFDFNLYFNQYSEQINKV